MINIDFLTLKAFFIENIDFFIGARLQKIQQPTRRDFVFFIRNQGESRKLYININPQIYHVAFMSKENEQRRNIIIPKKPPMFCMLLRKYIEGAKIIDARCVENERILELLFEVYDELSDKRTLCLAIELMGKYSNVILYDKDSSLILGCAHNVGEEKSRYRELQGGLEYIYPPQNGLRLSNELKSQFKNLSEDEKQKYLNVENYRPAVKGDRYTLFSELIEGSVPKDSVNSMIDDYYSEMQENQIINNLKLKLNEILNQKYKKVKNSICKIETLQKKRDNTDKYKLYGELLTANLYMNSDYKKEIEVFDYINGKNIIIELDETKNLKENAQRYYKLYTKSKTTKEKTSQMLLDLNLEKEYIENIFYSVNNIKSITDADDIKEELGINETKSKKTEKLSIEKVNINGFDVYIGKNNKQNDYIVSKLSKDDDIWFHTRLCAGSHVLLKTSGNEEPDENTVFECCKLARKYSSAAQPSKVGVIYTKAKNLKKPPASPLGYVTYKNEKEILV